METSGGLLILDFGSQYTQLIARRVRELGVYCEILPPEIPKSELEARAPKGVVLSGGPESVTADQATVIPQFVFDSGLPLLGICYGMQSMAVQLGGQVQSASKHEYGHALIKFDQRCAVFSGLTTAVDDVPNSLPVWMSHGDQVTAVPDGFQPVASSDNCPIAAMADHDRRYFGLQFHPEVTHTEQGEEILRHFAVGVCGCEATWTAEFMIEEMIADVREQVGTDHVILGLSGGVDSSVTAALLSKAIGDQLTCVFVDNGLLRLHETEQVGRIFGQQLGVSLITVDAREQFLEALKGEVDPEAKRKIIGREFIHVFQEQAKVLPGVKWLAQGTIYPDVIESAAAQFGGKAHVIKSHHNVGGLPEQLHLGLVEPLRRLFKDEVRRVGVALGLPHALVYRHPFPGPGLGVRVLGEIQAEYLEPLRKADAIFLELLHEWSLYEKVSQAFAVFLPVKSVGVVGDARRYAHVIALRCVETTDFMTARCAQLPPELLAAASSRIINEIPEISRVVYDISSKPPATIEWE